MFLFDFGKIMANFKNYSTVKKPNLNKIFVSYPQSKNTNSQSRPQDTPEK